VGDFFAYDRGLREGDLHPVMAAMNAMRYDAITLGNHEFNYGLEFLMKSLAQAEFPVVSANVLRGLGANPRADKPLMRPYTLLRRRMYDTLGLPQDLCIGVIGVAPPQITIWERMHLHGKIVMRDMVEAAAAWVPEMREAGADLVVMLAHTGIGALRHTDGMENAAIPLARIPGVDVLLTGHVHQVFPSRIFADIPGVDLDAGTIAGKPAVMSGFFGSHLGVIDLRLAREGGRWRLLSHHVETRALRDAAMNFVAPETALRKIPIRSPKVRRIVDRAHDMVLENIRQPIGRTTQPMNSFFVFLGHSAATALVAQAQAAYVTPRLGGTEHEGLPVLSSVSPSKAGGLGGPRNYTNIAAGGLTLRSLADLYTYPNRIAALRLSGAQIADWLERAASCYNQLHPGLEDEILLNPAHPAYNFEMVYGLEYDIDLTQPARFEGDGTLINANHARIRNLRHQGAPLDPQATFIVCTNSFRAHGAGGFAGAVSANVAFEAPAITRDVVRAFVQGQPDLTIDPTGPFRLMAPGTAPVILRTGPAAFDHVAEIAQFRPELTGVDKKGFIRLRVTL
jgi:2',3'-cyclic-nucleotide 2'-phosphodiesterase/3'-nucleotidase